MGYCLRISCRTPVLGPCLGLLGVGAASALAGHVSAHTGRLCREGGNPLKLRWWRPMQADEAVVDALLGLLVFKVRRVLSGKPLLSSEELQTGAGRTSAAARARAGGPVPRPRLRHRRPSSPRDARPLRPAAAASAA